MGAWKTKADYCCPREITTPPWGTPEWFNMGPESTPVGQADMLGPLLQTLLQIFLCRAAGSHSGPFSSFAQLWCGGSALHCSERASRACRVTRLPLWGYCASLGTQGLWEKDKQPLGTFFPFEFSLIVFLIDQRNTEASGTAQREKETCVGVVTSVGWALLPVLCSKGVGWLAQGLRHFPAAPFDARNSRNL